MMYVQENEETMPGADFWSAIDVGGKILICPTAGKKISNAYGYSNYLIDKGLGELADPTAIMLTCDAEGTDANIITAAEQISARHTDKPIVSYVDGHVALVSGIVGYTEKDFSFTDDTVLPSNVKVATGATKASFMTSALNAAGTGTAVTTIEAGKAEMVTNSTGIALKFAHQTGDNPSFAYLDFGKTMTGDFVVEFDWEIYRTGGYPGFFGLIADDYKMMFALMSYTNVGYNMVDGASQADNWTFGLYTVGSGGDGASQFITSKKYQYKNASGVVTDTSARLDLSSAFYGTNTSLWHCQIARVNNKITITMTNPAGILSGEFKSSYSYAYNLNGGSRGLAFFTRQNDEAHSISNITVGR